MYYWNLAALKKVLSERAFTEKEAFQYLLLTEFFYSLAIVPVTGIVNNNWDLLSGVLAVALAVLGCIYVYRQNGGENGQAFLSRFISLGIVVGIRFTILVFLPFLVAYLLIAVPLRGDIAETTWVDAVFFNGLGVLYYWSLGRHMRSVAQPKASSVTPA